MWNLWRERNSRNFEGSEKTIQDLKKFFLFTMLEWVTAMGHISDHSLLDLIELCSFAL